MAFLRGINLGRRRITNLELSDEFAALGLTGATAFLASGNVVFEAPQGMPTDLCARIEAGLRRSRGWEVPTFLRTADEVKAIAAQEVFAAELEGTRGRIQVALLATEPAAGARSAALDLASKQDRLAIQGRELYWLPCGNLSDSELDIGRIEAALGPMTIRTKRTLERIAARFLSG